MSLRDLHKWSPDSMRKHGLTLEDMWRDINKTRTKTAFVILLGAIAGGCLLGIAARG